MRNLVLGLPGGDFDICSAARPETAAAIVWEAGLSVTEKALELGTIEIRVELDGARHRFEHTTFRRLLSPGGAHRPYRWNSPKIFARTPGGADLPRARCTWTLSRGSCWTHRPWIRDALPRARAAAEDPDVTIRDDGLRIMRMARFAAELGFDVATRPSGMRCPAALLDDISPERKRDELMKILMADTKYPVLNVWDHAAAWPEYSAGNRRAEIRSPGCAPATAWSSPACTIDMTCCGMGYTRALRRLPDPCCAGGFAA